MGLTQNEPVLQVLLPFSPSHGSLEPGERGIILPQLGKKWVGISQKGASFNPLVWSSHFAFSPLRPNGRPYSTQLLGLIGCLKHFPQTSVSKELAKVQAKFWFVRHIVFIPSFNMAVLLYVIVRYII